ncbi:hypothetical protein [Kitasatospora nipponensis]
MIIALAICLGWLVAGSVRLVARWLRPGQPPGSGQRTDARERRVDPPGAVTWEEAELLLTAGLLAGLVGQADYQDGLELLACADDERSPLEVPSLRER